MEASTHAHLTFLLTGSHDGQHLQTVEGLGMRPALMARHRDLAALRYDFPLVLATAHPDGELVYSLSGLIDGALATTASNEQGDRIRHHALRLEREIRAQVSAAPVDATRHGRLLSELWDAAAARLEAGGEPSLRDSLRRVRAAIPVDGEVIDCDAALPARLARHAWGLVQATKVDAFHQRLDRLVLKLSDILKADYERSDARRDASQLKASVGTAFADAFDFTAMSQVLATAGPADTFPDSRRKRIYHLLAVLTSRAFLPGPGAPLHRSDNNEPFSFVLGSCREALDAFRERMPAVIALAKAIAMAELEIEGLYREARHDALFEQFGANGLDPQDLAAFPDYLVCLNAGQLQADEHARLMEILTSGLPIKVLLQIDDILEESPDGQGALTAGMRNRQVASMAIGLNEVYVLQAPGSHLFQFRDHLVRGLAYRGPALFSVFSGAGGAAQGQPPYLVAAAAMESRAFPAFAYDPSAGPNWAARFDLDANPQRDLDWPIHTFDYEDEQHQRVSADLAFTAVDFVAGDSRYTKHLARVPHDQRNSHLVPVDEALSRERNGLPDTVPSLLMVDAHDTLHTVVVDNRLIREARRCREMWHSLQELAGIHNSHAEALLARERKAWDEQGAQEAAVCAPATLVEAAPIAMVVAGAVDLQPAYSPDEAYIETARCSTCNECTTLNSKMFAYDANKQAYIADVTAGTYAQMVEAAESCQVSVIHPGKPRNPNEPGLDELLKRAEAFR